MQLTCTFKHLRANKCALLRAQIVPWCQLTCAKTIFQHRVTTQYHVQIARSSSTVRASSSTVRAVRILRFGMNIACYFYCRWQLKLKMMATRHDSETD